MTSSLPSANSLLPNQNRDALASLRRHWFRIVLGYAVVSLAMFVLLRVAWSPLYAFRWLILTVLFSLRPLWLLWHHLDENHPRDELRLYPQLGYGNWTTLIRGWFMAAAGGFVGSPWPTGWLGWLPAALYMFAVLLDGVDGYLARITNHTTKLGETLDISLDAWGAFLVIMLGVWYGQLPIWYLPLGFSHELFMAGQRWLKRRGRPVYDLTPSMERRAAAAAQMGFLSLVLWPIFAPPTTTIAAVALGGQLFLSFARDWLVVSGAVNPAADAYLRTRTLVKKALQGWLPILLRLLSVWLTWLMLTRETPRFQNWLSTAATPLPDPSSVTIWPWVVVGVAVLGAVMTLLGILPRFGALLLLILALLDQQLAGFAWVSNGLLELGAILIMQLGGGYGCLWRAEDRLWYTRAGEKSVAENDESMLTPP